MKLKQAFSVLLVMTLSLFTSTGELYADALNEIRWVDLERTRSLNRTVSDHTHLLEHWTRMQDGVFGLNNGKNRTQLKKNELLISVSRPPTPAEQSDFFRLLHISSVRTWNQHWVIRSRTLSVNQMEKLVANSFRFPWIQATERIYAWGGHASTQPNDPLYEPYQWNLPAIGMPASWAMEKGSRSVIVAVIDSGVDLQHPDLKKHLITGYNAVQPGTPPEDRIGHGTHVAGIIAAAVNNVRGVAGLTWNSTVMPVKVLNDQGEGDPYLVAKGIQWAVDHGADVINLSLGDTHPSMMLEDAIRYAVAKDVVVVGAAGNNGLNEADYPASYPDVINVSALDEKLQRANYANYGETVDLIAPGSHIASTFTKGHYASLSGTSMASPHVAAIAALVRAQHPEWSAIQVRNQLLKSAKRNGQRTTGRDPLLGYGLLDAKAALSVPSWPHRYHISPGLKNWHRYTRYQSARQF